MKLLRVIPILLTLLVTPAIPSITQAQKVEPPPLKILAFGNNRCRECMQFGSDIKRFFHETKWAKRVELVTVTMDKNRPELIPDFYRKGFVDGRTWELGQLPTFIVWANVTTKHPEGREVGRWGGYQDRGAWYEVLEIMLEGIDPHMREDGVFIDEVKLP